MNPRLCIVSFSFKMSDLFHSGVWYNFFLSYVIQSEAKDLKSVSWCIQILPPSGRLNDKRKGFTLWHTYTDNAKVSLYIRISKYLEEKNTSTNALQILRYALNDNFRIYIEWEKKRCLPSQASNAHLTIQNTNTTKRDFLYILMDEQSSYTTPCAIMAWATFMKPAMFAPFT